MVVRNEVPILSSLPANIDASPPWTRHALPWLSSVCVHAALIVLLALSFQPRLNAPSDHWLMAVSTGNGGQPGSLGSGDGDATVRELTSGDGELLAPGEVQSGMSDGELDSTLADLLSEPGGGRSAQDVALATADGPSKFAGLEDFLPKARAKNRSRRGKENGAGTQPLAGGSEIASAASFTRGAASGSGGQGKPGYAKTSVFGLAGAGRKFVYVFDRSGSMSDHAGAPLAAAKSQLLASLEDLGRVQQFQIIFYNEQPHVFTPSGTAGRLTFATDLNKSLAREFIGGIRADGGTRHEEALALAMKMAPDVIFFLTDADEPRMTAGQLDRIARLNRGTIVNAIEFGSGPASGEENFLMQLARQNGGRHAYVDVTRLARIP